ncbi:MAG TPA: aminoacyl-tRNA deacylase [Candidatus Limnocylindrales bacterium]|jgi:Cys-tRNA(Pro)/Cys-tRNA(Cys) deacylase
MTATGTRAIDLVRRSGVAHQVHAYEPTARHGRDRDARPSYGREAAMALGIEPGRLFKTLVASVDERLVLAVVPVDRELDPKALAEAVEGRHAELADPVVAERATGYVVGGISPIGTRRALPVILDVSATGRPTVFVSAGRRGLQVELAPDDLVRLTGAIVASVARDH